MPVLCICATSASSWSFTESPHFPDAPIFCLLSLRSKPPSIFLLRQMLLLLLQAARRVFGLATYSLICCSRTGPTAEFDDPGAKLLADIGRGHPACTASRHQKITCQL